MNMTYTKDTLYVDMLEESEMCDISVVKGKIFNVLDQYKIDNIVVNTKGYANKNKIASLKRDYYKIYDGTIKIN